MALTTQDIHAAADQLQEQGVKPTLAEVRRALGGGSFTTISDAMQSWKREQQEEQELQQVDLPSGITERLNTLGADMWQTAIDMANDRLSKEREALEVVKVKAQAETDEAQEAVKTLEGEQADLLQQLDEVATTAETATKSAQQATADHDATKQTLSDTKHQLELERTKAETAQSQLAEVRTALDKQSVELTSSLSKIATLEATADSDKAEIARLKAELKDAKSELKDAKSELKTVTAERNEIQTATAEIKGELKAITAERDKLSSINGKLTQAQATLSAEHKALDKQYHELSDSYKAEKERASTLTADIEKMRAVTTSKP